MADSKLLLKRGSDEEFLAEDDPLAELARIVGFEPAPVVKSAPPPRREPVFDLEDELLKELEIYSHSSSPEPAPAPEASQALPVSDPAMDFDVAVAGAPVASEMSKFEAQILPGPESEPSSVSLDALGAELAAPPRAPVILGAVETFVEPVEGRIFERPASHPVFDLEDEILREFAAFDARTVVAQPEQAVEAEIVHQTLPSLDDVPVELHDVPSRQAATASHVDEVPDVFDAFFNDDLHAAIRNAVDQEVGEYDDRVPELAPAHVSAESVAVQDDERAPIVQEQIEDGYWGEPSAGLGDTSSIVASAEQPPAPLASNSWQSPREPEPESVSVEPAERWSSLDVSPLPSREEVAASLVEDVPAPAFSGNVEASYSSTNDYGLDELLAEVEKYPVADSAGRWALHSKLAEPDDIDRLSPPVARHASSEPSYEQAPLDPFVALDADPLLADSVTDRSTAEPPVQVDLGAMEMEFSDLAEDAVALSPDLLSAIGDAVVPEKERDDVPTVQVSSPAAVNADYSSLPFDPTQIVQEEEILEAIAEMDVPDMEVAHEEERPAAHPEYDIDLDAEMAQLFVTATAPAVSSQRSGQTPDNVIAFDAVSPPKTQSGSIDLDEFERALEEDFRRSFSENRATSNPDRVALAPAAVAPVRARSNRNALLLAGAAAVIAVFGGAGVFAFMSGDTPILASSEPKVILADTDPVKVVPDDPGGKEVPNQNKAVYDRVSGAKVDETKQPSLVTSNEEPIDVVQRTLEPENLPMDDDAMAMATPTDDTADPRLLPDQAEQERVTTTSKVLSGVSPRKVKTMVVRPDGSLVEREVTDEDVKQQAANDAELMKIAQKAAQDAATANDSQADDIAKTIESVPERLAPSDDSAATPVEVNVANDAVAAEEPAPEPEPMAVENKSVDVPVETVSADTEAPVVAEAETPVVPVEPVKAVETTDLKPVEANTAETNAVEANTVEANTVEANTVEVKPVDRSLASANAQAVSEDSAAKLAETEIEDAPVRKVKTTKITPVPEVRPIDQPVNVVGTVSDQGTVDRNVEAKPQEVAAVDQTSQAVVETTPVPAGSYVIQIASLPSEAEAQSSYSKLSAKFGGIIGGKGVDIRKAEIKNKGTYYRVRIPAGSKQEAQALCAKYKQAGGSCLVSK